MAGEQASSGQGFGQARGYQNYQSTVDPEELFRTIFGDSFKSGRGFESMFDNDQQESFNTQTQVLCVLLKLYLIIKIIFNNIFKESIRFNFRRGVSRC
jgi:hypothetical protein